ncbi:hypothetical protein [Imhoffiella purpurea]|uniref:Uncharacterized protein n=1 Tax=Imhoffiella purpurea TaxID=1249627 RepID=W9VIM9_9GAMM|nr:hypothetical protein [Imhoffiella purpurea]EXJ16856.1 hypothetical protein D779_2467 [Imhoffiella purpurea]
MSTSTSSGASSTQHDLRASIATRLEQDPDYQILRKVFALEERIQGFRHGNASHQVDAPQDSQGSTLSVERSSAQDLSNETFSIKEGGLSWWREFTSVDRLEISASAGSNGWSISTESFQRASVRLDMSIGVPGVRVGDPLVLDLSGQGIMTTGVDSGIRFDLDGDGTQDQTSFATGGSWFLALDRDANGRIDNGHELFGDQNGAAHGFAELARYDDNGDGVIDASDEIFSKLKLTQVDENGEQVVKTLAEADVTALDLEYQNTRKALNLYDSVAQVGRFHRSDGTTGETADVLLGYSGVA